MFFSKLDLLALMIVLVKVFFQPKQFNLYPNDDTSTVIFTGVLTNVNRSISSIMVIMVVESESNDAVSMDCSPLTIICKSEDPQAGAKNRSHSIAGKLSCTQYLNIHVTIFNCSLML